LSIFSTTVDDAEMGITAEATIPILRLTRRGQRRPR
jgi:hypothetical protein